MTQKEYLQNPCGKLSLPYWKHKTLQLPKNIIIYHENEFFEFGNYVKVEKYFRIKHDLKELKTTNRQIETISIHDDTHKLINHINICYNSQNISITELNINDWINSSVYDQNLWIKITKNNNIIASGIAEFDSVTKEGILEWIQVDPKYQRKGYGKIIVCELLKRLSKKAAFVTVSGKLDNLYNPLKLYQSCGFTGNDIWYICHL